MTEIVGKQKRAMQREKGKREEKKSGRRRGKVEGRGKGRKGAGEGDREEEKEKSGRQEKRAVQCEEDWRKAMKNYARGYGSRKG